MSDVLIKAEERVIEYFRHADELKANGNNTGALIWLEDAWGAIEMLEIFTGEKFEDIFKRLKAEARREQA